MRLHLRTPAVTAGHPEHHPVRDALSTAGGVFRDALLSIAGEHHPEPWEVALARYEQSHPRPELPRGR